MSYYLIGFGGSELYWIITIRYVVAKRMSCKNRKLNVIIILLLCQNIPLHLILIIIYINILFIIYLILIGRYLLHEKMINLQKKNHWPKL